MNVFAPRHQRAIEVKWNQWNVFFYKKLRKQSIDLYLVATDTRLRVKLDRIYPKEQFDTTVSLIWRNYCDSDPNRHYGLNSICLCKVTQELVCLKLDWRQKGLGINKCQRQKYHVLMSLMS